MTDESLASKRPHSPALQVPPVPPEGFDRVTQSLTNYGHRLRVFLGLEEPSARLSFDITPLCL